MEIVIKNKRCKRENIEKEYPGCVIFDVTSKGEMKQLSPFYPHGGIPIPFSQGATSMCVEGIWQGLKVFQSGEGIDRSCFRNDTMKGLKRTFRTHGKCIGHQKGIMSKELLEYIQARKEIYVPSYFWMLEHKCNDLVEKIRNESKERTVVLLDYDTNGDIDDWHKPLSHASLIKRFIEESEQ